MFITSNKCFSKGKITGHTERQINFTRKRPPCRGKCLSLCSNGQPDVCWKVGVLNLGILNLYSLFGSKVWDANAFLTCKEL